MSGRNEWERCVVTCRERLVERLIVNTSLLRALREDSGGQTLLTRENEKEIAQEGSQQAKADTLLRLLTKKRPRQGTCLNFCKALQTTGQRHLADTLSKSLHDDYERRRLLQSLVINEPDSRSSSPTLKRSVPPHVKDIVARVAGPRWRHLGSELGLSDFELKSCERVRNEEGKARQVLQTWENRRGSMATLAVLLQTCSRIQVKTAVDAECMRREKDPISRLGPLAAEIYREAMLTGSAPLYRALIHIVGSGDSGKTSLILSLLKLAFEKGVAALQSGDHVGVCNGADWRMAVDDDEHLDSAIARCFLATRRRIMKSGSRKAALREMSNESREDAVDDGEDQLLLLENIDVEKLRCCCELTSSLADVVDKLDKKSIATSAEEVERDDHKPEAAINFIEHATDNSFFAIHLALMDEEVDYPTSMYVLVFKLTQLLDRYSQLREGETGRGYDALTRVARAVRLAFPVVEEDAEDGIGMSEDVAYPPTAIVGTHAGEAEVQWKIDNLDKMVKRVVDEANCQSNLILPKKQVESLPHLRDPSRHKANNFFSVDNTKAGKEREDPVVVELRERIFTMIRTFWSARVKKQPMRWHCFEKIVKALRKYLHRGRCSLATVRLLAKRLCYMPNHPEVDSMLQYLKGFGSVLYYPRWTELQDTVFINPQWLVNIMTTFVIGVQPPDYLQEHWDLARLRGLITPGLVEYLLTISKVHFSDFQEMTQILGHFGFLFPLQRHAGDRNSALIGYFAPFLMTTKFQGLPALTYTSYNLPPPLVFAAEDDGLLFEPLFLRLAGRCLEHFPKLPEMKRDRCVFHTPDGIDMELFYYQQRYIILTIFNVDDSIDTSSLNERCVDLRLFLTKQLQLAKKRGMAGLRLKHHLLDATKLRPESAPLCITEDCMVPRHESDLPNSKLWSQQEGMVKSPSGVTFQLSRSRSVEKLVSRSSVIAVSDLPLPVSANLFSALSSDQDQGGWRGLADELHLDGSTQDLIERLYEDRSGGVVYCWEKQQRRHMDLKHMYDSVRRMEHRQSVAILDEFLQTFLNETRLAINPSDNDMKDERPDRPLKMPDSHRPSDEETRGTSVFSRISAFEVSGAYQSGVFTEVLDAAVEVNRRVDTVEENVSAALKQFRHLRDKLSLVEADLQTAEKKQVQETEGIAFHIHEVQDAIVSTQQRFSSFTSAQQDARLLQDLGIGRHRSISSQIKELQTTITEIQEGMVLLQTERQQNSEAISSLTRDMDDMKHQLQERHCIERRDDSSEFDGSKLIELLGLLPARAQSADECDVPKVMVPTETVADMNQIPFKDDRESHTETVFDSGLTNCYLGVIEEENCVTQDAEPKPVVTTTAATRGYQMDLNVEMVDLPTRQERLFQTKQSISAVGRQYHSEVVTQLVSPGHSNTGESSRPDVDGCEKHQQQNCCDRCCQIL